MLDHMCWACNGDARELNCELMRYFGDTEELKCLGGRDDFFQEQWHRVLYVLSFSPQWGNGRKDFPLSSSQATRFVRIIQEKNKSHVVRGQRDNHGLCAWEYWGPERSWSHPPAGRAEGDRSSLGISHTFTHLTDKSVCFSSDSQEQNSLEPFLNSAQEKSQKKTVTLIEELWLWISRGRRRNQKSERDTACIKGVIKKASEGVPLRTSHKNAVLGTVSSRTLQGQRARLPGDKSTGQLRNPLLFISTFPPLTLMEPETVLARDRRKGVKGREMEEKLTLPLLPHCSFPSWRRPGRWTWEALTLNEVQIIDLKLDCFCD